MASGLPLLAKRLRRGGCASRRRRSGSSRLEQLAGTTPSALFSVALHFFLGQPPLLKRFARRGLLLASLLALLLGGCGYRLANRRFNNGVGQTIAIPTFANGTTSYRVEQRLTDAIRREMIQRTRFGVTSEGVGDLVVSGEVIGFSEIPILFNEQSRASSYSISVDLKIRVTDSKTGQVVFQNDFWTFREVFELARASQDFVLEDSAAIERLAKRVASSLVSSLLHAAP